MRKRIISLCLALVLCLAMLPVNAMAATPVYVALGDSISTGYKPGTPPGKVDTPFVDAIKNMYGYSMQYCSEDGLTSEGLLNKINSWQNLSRNAELVTITIGGNDLMNALYDFLVQTYNTANPGKTITKEQLMAAFLEPQKNILLLMSIINYVPQFAGSTQASSALSTFETNLGKILDTVQQNATNATIIIANQYNPYSHITDSSAATIVNTFETVVTQMNAKITQVAQTKNVKVADIYTEFKNAASNPTNAAFSTSDLGNANLDIHPNQSGHDIIAQTISEFLSPITEYSLWVDGTQVTASNASNVLGDNTVSYDPDTYTLTLNGAKLTECTSSSLLNKAVIYMDSSKLNVNVPTVTVNIQGENAITTDAGMGIWNENGSIKLTGTGSLNVDGSFYCYGDLKIQDSAVIDCVSLYSEAGNVIISGNDVQVTAKTKEGSSIPALEAKNGDITISGGAYVKATGTMGPGIYAHDAAKGITISGSGTVVEAATSDEQSAAIQAMRNGKVMIEDGAVVRATGPKMGIYSEFSPQSGDSSYPITIVGSWVETTETNSTRGVGNSVLFEGGAGTVYGTIEVPDGVSISQGKTLTISEGKKLIVPNNITLVNEGIMEISSGAEFTGAADVEGTVYVFEDGATNPVSGATFSLTENGKVYSQLTQLSGTTFNDSRLRTGVNHSYNGTTFANEWSYYVPSPVGPSNPTTSYSVVVSGTENGTVTASPNSANKGDKVTLTVAPAEGYELGTLTAKDAKGNTVALTKVSDTEYTFVMPDSNVTVSATFVEKNATPFTDVKTADWWYEAVKYVYENKLMAGTSTTTFEPTAKLNRAQAVQILYNLEGQPAVTGTADFTDVSGHWALNAITWGAENNVVAGVGNGKFDPNADVTREQFAQMMYNYAKFKGYDLSAAGDLNSFSDVSKVSDWAVAALTWANGEGLINGNEDGTLAPNGTAIRGEAASILMNFDQNVAK